MLSQTYHVIRSRSNGNYLAAHPETKDASHAPAFLLLFREDYDALSYLNTHADEQQRNRLAVETIAGSQVAAIAKRWDFKGMAIVTDPLVPNVEFMAF